MDKKHADYLLASQSIKGIFSRLHQNEDSETYNGIREFKDALMDWLEEYSSPSRMQKLNDIQKVQYLGNKMLFLILSFDMLSKIRNYPKFLRN